MNTTIFSFESNELRTVVDEQGNPWFVASDVLQVLKLDRKALERIYPQHKGVNIIHTLGGNQKMTTINEAGLYSLIFTSRKQEAEAFTNWVTSEVLPSIRKTGSYSVPQQQPARIPLDEIARSLEVANNMLNVCPSGKLKSMRQLYENYGVNANILPDYTIDAPTVTAGSSESTMSLTEILKRTNTPLSAVVANRKLHELGLLKQESRKSSSGLLKNYWSVTETGLKYGKNVTSDKNQRETQPHWYVKTMNELVNLLK